MRGGELSLYSPPSRRRLVEGASRACRTRNGAGGALEQVPKKLIDFFDEDLLQHFDIERFPIDHMIPCDREAL